MSIIEQIEKEFGVKFVKHFGEVVRTTIDIGEGYKLSLVYGLHYGIHCTKDTVEVGVLYDEEPYETELIGEPYSNVDLEGIKKIISELKGEK